MPTSVSTPTRVNRRVPSCLGIQHASMVTSSSLAPTTSEDVIISAQRRLLRYLWTDEIVCLGKASQR